MLLSIKNLNKSFRSNTVLADVNLSLPSNSINCLLGVNGSGKSTLVNLITGLLYPDSGQIVYDDNIVKSDIGASFQDTTISATARVVDIIKDQCGLYNVTLDKEWMNELFELLELKQYSKYKISKLSGGTRRRVMLVMALIHKPQFVILDEPTADVDFILRRKIWDFLLKYKQTGATILFTTHLLSEAQQFADNVYLLHHKNIRTIVNQNSLLNNKKVLQIKVDNELKEQLKLQLPSTQFYQESEYLISYVVDDLEMLAKFVAILRQLSVPIDYIIIDPCLEDIIFKEINNEI